MIFSFGIIITGGKFLITQKKKIVFKKRFNYISATRSQMREGGKAAKEHKKNFCENSNYRKFSLHSQLTRAI